MLFYKQIIMVIAKKNQGKKKIENDQAQQLAFL
jgi:hypothetical protein